MVLCIKLGWAILIFQSSSCLVFVSFVSVQTPTRVVMTEIIVQMIQLFLQLYWNLSSYYLQYNINDILYVLTDTFILEKNVKKCSDFCLLILLTDLIVLVYSLLLLTFFIFLLPFSCLVYYFAHFMPPMFPRAATSHSFSSVGDHFKSC